ncbi:Rv2231c family pyridoxal phosphate-dependent protein CobC [Streptomyces sp. NPDC002889]|uniref:Rv2231c family pyridoxal phosphate-dependent protein CobC n=1 Tax=Streptomyces sp. NPDC002889 TaxID=3364669 RepID=UPI00368FCF7E
MAGAAVHVVGVGASRGVSVGEVLELVVGILAEAGLSAADVVELASVDTKGREPGIVGAAERLGVPLVTYSAARLAAVEVPNPSEAVLGAVGTPSVAEAAALAGGGELLVPKRRSSPARGPAGATCAVARRREQGEPGTPATTPPESYDVVQPSRPARPGRPSDPGTTPRTCGPANPYGAPGTNGPSDPYDPMELFESGRGPVLAGLDQAAPDMMTVVRAGRAAGPPSSGAVSRRMCSVPARPHTQESPMTRPPGPPRPVVTDGHDLRHHGDAEVRDGALGLIDLAVNVRTGTPPAWLRDRIAGSLAVLAAYPDGRAARAAVAERHGLPVERVLLTAGAAEAFVLLARGLEVRRPLVVHPQFTEPEAALRDAGHEVARLLLREEDGFRLDPKAVPEEADLVVVGNPTNPTSVLHPADDIARLARPGRVLVVDEAFMDAVPGERETLAGRTDVPGLVVLRSLTKTWGLAGLRIGYVLAEPETNAALEQAQPLWPVSTPALAAAEACMGHDALAEAELAAHCIATERAHLLAGLAEFDEVRAVETAQGPFVLVRVRRGAEVRERLRGLGFAARRGDTFPGLDTDWLRLAVRDRVTTNRFLQALDQALSMVGPLR